MITLAEYKEELELIKKQNKVEEELYPYICMLLREAGYTKKYSVRSVAKGRSDGDTISKSLFRGYASFPDIVILDKDFVKVDEYKGENYYNKQINNLYGCVEVKIPGRELLNLGGKIEIKNDSVVNIKRTAGAYYRYCGNINNKLDEDFMNKICGGYYELNKEIKDKEIKKYINYSKGMLVLKIKENNVEKEEKLDISAEMDWECKGEISSKPVSMETMLNDGNFCVAIQQSNPIAYVNNENYELIKVKGTATDEGQLIGELLWYGRVIYTNGYEWKYLTIKDFYEVANLRKKYLNDKLNWYELFNNENFEVIEIPLINIDNSTTESDWEDFKTKLRYISKDWNKSCTETPQE